MLSGRRKKDYADASAANALAAQAAAYGDGEATTAEAGEPLAADDELVTDSDADADTDDEEAETVAA
jgi:hypothetical protein